MDHPFDIEQDNNPTNSSHPHKYNTDLLNNSINVANKLELLLQDPNFDISVKSTEKLINSSVIVYLIQITNGQDTITIKRRYSEFKSLRDNLCKLYPVVVIPPIPSKHSILKYLLNSLDNQQEVNLINFRINYFNRFLRDLLVDGNGISGGSSGDGSNGNEQITNKRHENGDTNNEGNNENNDANNSINIIHGVNTINFKSESIVKKFLDPNYELCWTNVLMEPPLNQLPKNLLLCNPLDPLDQNGLYLLLPKLNNFTNDLSELHNLRLDSMNKLNDNLLKLNNQIKYYKFPGSEFKLIPQELIDFEAYCHNTLNVIHFLNKVNVKHNKNFKLLLAGLINLGGNLNNFSLEIFELNKQLSTYIEKFGSIIDSNYLNYEAFLFQHLIPNWQESINQLIHYFEVVLDIIGFYKFKVIQFLILYKLKFKKFNQLVSMGDGDNFENLKSLDSPSVNNFLKNKVKKKSSWYNVFGGSQQPPRVQMAKTSSQASSISEHNDTNTIERTSQTSRIESLQAELDKIDQLLYLSSFDLMKLNEELLKNFNQFQKFIELKWCVIFMEFIKSTKQLFIENLNDWIEFREFFT